MTLQTESRQSLHRPIETLQLAFDLGYVFQAGMSSHSLELLFEPLLHFDELAAGRHAPVTCRSRKWLCLSLIANSSFAPVFDLLLQSRVLHCRMIELLLQRKLSAIAGQKKCPGHQSAVTARL